MKFARGVTRRGILVGLSAGASIALLDACGSSVPSFPSAGSASGSPSSAAPSAGGASLQAKPSSSQAGDQPRSGGTLKMGMTGDLKSLDPMLNSATAWVVMYSVFNRLTEYDAKLQPQPSLAQSWDVSQNGKQYKVSVRPGVQFHSGRELTSDDVKYSLIRAANPKTAVGQLAELASWFTDMQTPDKNTAVLTLDQPRNGVFDLFEQMNIVDKISVPTISAPKMVIGTGPFTFGEWVQGDHITLSKNKNYWMPGKPYLDGITYQIFKDAQTQLAAFEAGALDIVDSLPYRDLIRLQMDPKYSVTDGSAGFGFLLSLNTTFPPLDNQKVRQALNYAIDRKRIAETVFFGLADPVDLFWPSNSAAFDAAKNSRYAFDLDKAKSLLAESGVSNVQLDFVHQGSDPDMATAGQIYQADLAKIGVKINGPMVLDPVAFQAAALHRSYKGIAASRFGPLSVLPHITILSNAGISPATNYADFKDPQYAQIIQSMGTEPDAAKYKQLAGRLNDLLLDASAIVPIAIVRTPLIMQAKVHDARRTLGTWFMLGDAWIG